MPLGLLMPVAADARVAFRVHDRHLPLAGFGEINETLVRHDQVVRLRVVGEHGDRPGRHLDRHDLFFRRLRAGVNPSVRSDFKPLHFACCQ